MNKDTYRNIILLRKPISEPNLALNVGKHSTCALNVRETQVKNRWTRNMIVDRKMVGVLKETKSFKVVGK